jgi:hypothetical protein
MVSRTGLLAAVTLATLALPALAGAERVVTRKGETIVGEARFEKDQVVVVTEDGREVRIARSEVERIELSPEEAEPEGGPAAREAEPPAGEEEAAPEEAPEEEGAPAAQQAPPRTPPPPPYPGYAPYAPPPPPPLYRERAYDQNGFILSFGYQRGLAVGGEYQHHLSKNFLLGVGGQVAIEPGDDDGDAYDEEGEAYGTFGVTGRAYVGRAHRLALEVGFGLNAIDPHLEPGCAFEESSCAERNYGPEFSAGYQFVTDTGFVFETLFGGALVTNERYRDAHGPVNPLFQLKFGYLFR